MLLRLSDRQKPFMVKWWVASFFYSGGPLRWLFLCSGLALIRQNGHLIQSRGFQLYRGKTGFHCIESIDFRFPWKKLTYFKFLYSRFFSVILIVKQKRKSFDDTHTNNGLEYIGGCG